MSRKSSYEDSKSNGDVGDALFSFSFSFSLLLLLQLLDSSLSSPPFSSVFSLRQSQAKPTQNTTTTNKFVLLMDEFFKPDASPASTPPPPQPDQSNDFFAAGTFYASFAHRCSRIYSFPIQFFILPSSLNFPLVCLPRLFLSFSLSMMRT